MKKAFLFSFGLFVALSSLFVSCSDNNGDDDKNDSLICQISVSSTNGGSAKITNYIGSSVDVLIGNGVEVVATPNENYEFIGWFIGDSETAISTEAAYTFTVEENVSLVAKFYKPFDSNGYDYVDLGLPSGIKWASFNVGATKPEEYGGYYAWGETEEKENYSWSTYKWCNGSSSTMTKYCTDSSYGAVDNKTVLDPEDDVAHVKWGGDWRMPTKAEQDELRNNCTWAWATQNGVNGYKVTGPNGNSIFLPAAGYRLGADVSDRGGYGGYWSGSLSSYRSDCAYDLSFNDDDFGWNGNYRYYGRSVRPVLK